LGFAAWHRPISGKLIQNRASSRKMIFTEFRGVTQADFWKTHPNIDEFSRNLPGSCPDISQKLHRYSQNIDGVGLRHAPENSNFGKISG